MVKKSRFFNTKVRIFIIVAIFIVVIVFILARLLQINPTYLFYVLFGSAMVLFLPGFFATFIFFPKRDGMSYGGEDIVHNERALDMIERITLAILLSIVITSAIVFGLHNLFETSRLTPRNLALSVIFVNIISGAVAIVVAKLARKTP